MDPEISPLLLVPPENQCIKKHSNQIDSAKENTTIYLRLFACICGLCLYSGPETKNPVVDGVFDVSAAGRSTGHDADKCPALRSLDVVTYLPVSLGEQSMVVAAADIGAGVITGTALANQDAAGGDLLTTEALDAQALGF